MKPSLCLCRVITGAFVIMSSSCISLEPPAERPPKASPNDMSARQDMTRPPDMLTDMRRPPDLRPPVDMSQDMSDQGGEMTPSCEPSGCVMGETRCSDVKTLERCEQVNGCLSWVTTTCTGNDLCAAATSEQPAQCVANPCTKAETLCSPDQRAAITCKPTALDGVFAPESVSCTDQEVCVMGQCVAHQCSEQQLNAPYLCKDATSYHKCELRQGQRVLSAPTSCAAQQRCVDGRPTAEAACRCEHQCELNEASCAANNNGMYQVCVTNPQTSCRRWEARQCPAPRTNIGYDWDDMGCFLGQRHLKCWTFGGYCTLDQEPGRCP